MPFLALTTLRLVCVFVWTNCNNAWSIRPIHASRTIIHKILPIFATSPNRIDDFSRSDNSINQERLNQDSIIDAASAVTQSSCRLLGIKSIGVDYGLVKTGVALTVGYEPKPLTILRELNRTLVVQDIVRLAQLERASQIVVGLPLHKNGTLAEQTNLTLDFAHELAVWTMRELGPKVPIVLWDERYTSKAAVALGGGGSNLYGTLDDSAACIILECYYKSEYSEDALTIELSPEIQEECLQYFENKQLEGQQKLQQALEERELKMLKRKEAMDRFKTENSLQGVDSGKKKKKKKKK